MIKALEGKAPAQAVAMFSEFKDVQWKGLNSYVHGGIHALQRHGSGYPIHLEEIIKSSNGLLTMTAMVAAIQTGNEMVVKDIARIQNRHKDCMPDLLAY